MTLTSIIIPNRSDINLNPPTTRLRAAEAFPVFDGLDINQMIEACQDVHGTYYGVRTLWYGRHGQYQTLMPYDNKSDAPRYRLEQNMNGFYLLDDKFEYDECAQARMMSLISKRELPAYLNHPEINIKPFDIKLEEIELDLEIEEQMELVSALNTGQVDKSATGLTL